MKKIKFSVLMSIYKNDKVSEVRVAIDSLLNQTLLPNQIVIMEDGKVSKKLDDLLESYVKNNKIIEIYKRDKNLGLGLTLNEGLNYCKFDYVARMDSDDYCYPNRFEREIDYILNHPEVDVVGCNIEEYDEKLKNKLAMRVVPEHDNEIKKYMKKRNGINHMTVIYRKDSVLKAGSYEDCLYFEDYYLWCKMIKNGCYFYNFQEPLMKVRAGFDMTKRRGGFSYNKCILNFENKIYKIGIINRFEYMCNLIVRISVANIPNFLRAILYKKKLRRCVNE